MLCSVATLVLENLYQDAFSLLQRTTPGTLSATNMQYYFFQYSLPSLCFLPTSQKFWLRYFHCALCFISGFVFYFVLFYFLEHFSKFLGVFCVTAIGMVLYCPDNVSAVISCSKYCRISHYITVRSSCQEKRVSDWFFIEKHGYIYLVCYYKYSSSRLWPGEFQAHWGQWKSGTWLQWSQDFHPDFCLFGELELTMIVDKNPGTTQQFLLFFFK